MFARPRLFLSILAGFVVLAILPVFSGHLRGVTRFLVGWDVGVGLYLALAFRTFVKSDAAHIHRQSLLQDEGGLVILVRTIVSAAASVGTTREETFAPPAIVFLLLTIMLSWVFIHTMFALYYAHAFYAKHRKDGGGLIFPGDPEPTYWDFVYLALSIGTATQVSDVEIFSKRIRRTVTVHGIVAFFFNVTVIALTVGLVGDAIRNGSLSRREADAALRLLAA